jgi:FkbM family methyltransferase
MSKFILFDIGANWGQDSLPKTAGDINVETWAFEPTPALANYLINSSEKFKDRYHVVPVAIDNFNGEAEFFIQDNPGMGCNSLNQFNKDVIDKYWLSLEGVPRRDEFRAAGSIKVPVFTLATWLEENLPNLEKIDYFHCDTQGSDLRVLMGMGEYIHLIKQGVVECARDEDSKLYVESTNIVEETCDFIESKGFKITEIKSNDHMGNELNVYFEKP